MPARPLAGVPRLPIDGQELNIQSSGCDFATDRIPLPSDTVWVNNFWHFLYTLCFSKFTSGDVCFDEKCRLFVNQMPVLFQSNTVPYILYVLVS